MSVSIVVARSRNNVIGANGKIPWHIPEDFAHFKETTSGHPIVMGRTTFESIGKPLPNRTSIVVTRNKDWHHDGVLTFDSLPDAIRHAQTIDDEIFVIGGGQIYAQALELGLIDQLIVSEISEEFDGDTYFEIPEGWIEVAREDKGAFMLVRYRLS